MNSKEDQINKEEKGNQVFSPRQVKMEEIRSTHPKCVKETKVA